MTRRTSSLAIAKTRLPQRRRELLRRPRLIDHLHAQVDKQVFLISAPAGYGKTSLLVDWAHEVDFPVAWLTLDEFDNTPHVFLAYLVEAIRVHFPKFGAQALAALEQSRETKESLQSIVVLLANELARLPDHVVMVLDDCHVIENEMIGQLIAWLIRYAAEDCHFFINSRVLVDLPDEILMRARGQIDGIGINELCFTAPEIQAFVQQNYGLTVPTSRAQELAQITAGWITALLLMGQRAGWRSLVEDVLTAPEITGSLFDYFAEQILARQPEEVRRFMLGSAVLEPLSPDLLDQLPGLADSKTYLEIVWEQQLFLTRLEGANDLFVYHPLLRDFLRTRLKSEHPAWFEQLELACARLNEQQGQWDRAVEIYLALGRTEEAIVILQSVEASLRKRSDIARSTHWVQILPESKVLANPHLLSLKGKICMAQGEQEQAVLLFDQAIRGFRRAGDYASAGDKLVFKATVLRFLGRYRECIAESRKLVALLGKVRNRPAREHLHAASLHLRGLAKYHLGKLKEAYADLKQARILFQVGDDLVSQANVNSDLGIVARASGRIAEAIDRYKEALALWERLDDSNAAANTLNNLGMAYLFRGEIEAAEHVLQDALVKARQGGWARIEAAVLSSLGDLWRDQGQYARAMEFYTESLRAAEMGQEAQLIFYNRVALGHMQRLLGSPERAREWFQLAAEGIDLKSLVARGQLKLSQGLLASDRRAFKSAYKLVDAAAQSFRRAGNKHLEAVAEYHFAHLCRIQKREDEAKRHLIQVDALVETLGYDHFLAVEGRQTIDTLRFASGLKPIGRRFKRIFGQMQPILIAEPDSTTTNVPSLTIRTLGQEEIVVDGSEVVQIRTQVRDVFFFLLSRLPQGARREEIADLIWPDWSAERADGALRIAVSRIRKAICPVQLVNGQYVLAPENQWYDVQELERGLAHAHLALSAQARIARLQPILELYRGPYLERLDAHWALNERERLKLVYNEALMPLGEAYLEVGDLGSALSTFLKTTEVEPFLETAWKRAMETYVSMGDRAAAIALYEKLKQLLHEEMNMQPGRDIQSLYEDILKMNR
ncbi:MAG: tetratricopeptide repeat protein [Chloroflexi bacterium]|nr:tetratricopeptide repeat protein [Chloroflexota bacterium]